MHTLLIDNYDSFTYNLFDLIARVNGRDPDVVRNDAPMRTAEELLTAYDNVVVSPGPGTPCSESDLGAWGAVFGYPDVPVLGVCLGHQAMCHFHGAAVRAAPEPRHGRPSVVEHRGTGLFAGVPSPFSAIRYHSLAVSDLPDTIEAIAWSEDGVVMGVRHRKLPQWGVQFHPESIGTEHGHRLLRNFAELTSQGRRTGRRPAPRPKRAAARQPTHRVVHRALPANVDPEELFAGLFGDSPTSFWLDSSDGTGYSFMGDGSLVARADVQAATVTVTSASGEHVHSGGFFDWLGQDLAGRAVDVPDDLPFGFSLGWVGYLGYELKAECGGAPAHRSEHPDATLLFADRAIAIDQRDGRLHLVALVPADRADAADRWFDATAARIADLPRLPPVAAPNAVVSETSARHDAAAYRSLIDECMRELNRGETYEVCLTNALTAEVSLDGWESYRRLRALSPAPYAAYLKFGELEVLSTSPERFLKIDADGTMESKPIKGTRPRGHRAADDLALVDDLRSSPKDRAENMMIVDLMRNDLGHSAVVGSVHVPRLFEVETYATVHQLVSTVRARKRPEIPPVEAVRRAFPGGSMTGAPKIRTMQIIDRLEGGPRGIYSGAIGYFALSGAVDLGMTIRTVVAAPGRAGYGVGGAIITLSDPAAEVRETVTKAVVFGKLLGRPTADLLGRPIPDPLGGPTPDLLGRADTWSRTRR